MAPNPSVPRTSSPLNPSRDINDSATQSSCSVSTLPIPAPHIRPRGHSTSAMRYGDPTYVSTRVPSTDAPELCYNNWVERDMSLVEQEVGAVYQGSQPEKEGRRSPGITKSFFSSSSSVTLDASRGRSASTSQPLSSSRSRLHSTSRSKVDSKNNSPATKTQDLPTDGTISLPVTTDLVWWGSSIHFNTSAFSPSSHVRPWSNPPKRKKTVPDEQSEGWLHTRGSVAQAVHSIIGTAGDITHELLELSIDWLDFAPVPGLQTAAKTLLQIWDTLQQVDLNRLACLRLTQRCANILLSVRQEVKDAGDTIVEELKVPISKLEGSFCIVQSVLEKQVNRPFLKRYLKRDEILRQITGCDTHLTDALEMFNLSIQIRILKQVQLSEARRQAETQALLNSLFASGTLVSGVMTGLTQSTLSTSPVSSSIVPVTAPSEPSILPSVQLPLSTSPMEVITQLRALHTKQNELDMAHDLMDLRQLMKEALSAGSDAEMIRVLQVGREEMPEAIKALQRELEREVEKEGSPLEGVGLGLRLSGGGVTEASAAVAAPAIVRPRNVRKVSVTQVPVLTGPHPLTVDAGGNVVLEDLLESNQEATQAQAGETGVALNRSKTVLSVESADSGYSSATRTRDTLDREFMESGIDALRRVSGGWYTALPSWTITKFEVEQEELVGVGYFSQVYKGTWHHRTVAIKVLVPTTPRKLFIREVEIWRTLKHPHVLELYGASSTTSDPPWFFVSPYVKNGTLAQWLGQLAAKEREKEKERTSAANTVGASGITGSPGLSGRTGTSSKRAGSPGRVSPGPGTRADSPARMATTPTMGSPGGWRASRSASGTGSPGPVRKELDLLRYMHEVAKGMEYLHSNGVLHGDLKAANILVTDRIHCVITDFGQSEMKSEAFRLSGTPIPHGTLRWQAPELMEGSNTLTIEMDVYSFAITCIEILDWGRVPWQLADDNDVRNVVLKENLRPLIPFSRFSSPQLQELLRLAWHHDPSQRPQFSWIAQTLRQMRKNANNNVEEVASPPLEKLELEPRHRPSPDMHPIPLPLSSSPRSNVLETFGLVPNSADALSYRSTPRERSLSPPTSPSRLARSEESVATEDIMPPDPVVYGPASPPHSCASSIFESSPSSQTEDKVHIWEYDGYESPPPTNEIIQEVRNEMRYRMVLTHEFHPSLTLPLWSPSPVVIGAVGYLLKPQGSFVTLFNAFQPFKSAGIDMPSLHGYGHILVGKQRQDKRNAAQRGFDTLAGLLTFRSGNPSQSISRRYSFPLRAGHRAAYICTESTMYQYVDNLETPKKWFKANVDTILNLYGSEHHIQKEDLYLVIGTLHAPDYALFVSHKHPDGQVHFNVFSGPKLGSAWGKFVTDTEMPLDLVGPSYHEKDAEEMKPVYASKVSRVNGRAAWDTILLAKLRFKPDAAEPTSL